MDLILNMDLEQDQKINDEMKKLILVKCKE
jgi:hypothetical protein